MTAATLSAKLDVIAVELRSGDPHSDRLAANRLRTLLRGADHATSTEIETAWRSFAPSESASSLKQAVLAARTDDAAAMLLLARLQFGAGKATAALELVRGVAARAPTAEVAFLLCTMLLKRGDPEAQQVLQLCLSRFPQASQGWTELGHVLLGLGKKAAALVCFTRGEPSFTTALQRGLLARELGQLSEAREAFGQAVQFNPSSPRAWFLLGTCAQDARDFVAAAEAYATVLTLDPGVAEAAVNLGIVRQETDDLDGAREAYRQAVQTRADTFGRVAQALSTSSKGELWLDLGQLRRSLAG